MRNSVRRQPFAPVEAANAITAYPADQFLGLEQSLARLWINSGLIRSDLKRGFAGLSGTATGAPLDLRLQFLSASNRQAPLANHTIHIWHADASGKYSVYNKPDTNYLRGIGVTDTSGRVRFSTVFPGTYRGRIPHIHFEVYRNLEALEAGAERIIRSRLLFPDHITRAVYSGSSCYVESLACYKELNFERPVTEPRHDRRSVQMASVTSCGADTLRASMTAFLSTSK